MLKRIFCALSLTLAAAAGGSEAVAAEKRCFSLLQQTKPQWVRDLRPLVLDDLAVLMAQIETYERLDAHPPTDREARCGCMSPHFDWDWTLANFPDWYRTESISTGKLAEEWARLNKVLLDQRTAFARKHCR